MARPGVKLLATVHQWRPTVRGLDAERDRAAILRVIEEETAAYFAKDYETWARCWVITSSSQRWMRIGGGGNLVWSGEDYAKRMKEGMDRSPAPSRSASDVRRDNVDLHVRGDIAWVTFDQHAPDTKDAFDVPGLHHEMRVLEREAGTWKIVFACNMQGAPDRARSPLLRVDGSGVILWKNAAATEYLRSAQTLFVGAGRLRAHGRDADGRLRSAIRWAADVNETLPTERMFARADALPVVVAGGQGEPATVCWVTAESDTILVAINDPGMTEERLGLAAAVYGITPAQRRIAAEIVAGHDLVAAAERMGITINTARTQLQRMFEKVGVRSQPALVRALFSFTSRPL
jgi:DNA-binding CsgD family transcriptional regulator